MMPSLCLALAFSFLAVTSASYNDTDRLYAHMTGMFDNRIRPIQNQSAEIDVYVRFFLMSILNIDEVTQQVDVNGWVNFTWKDEFRSWDPNDFDGHSVIHPKPLDFWRPRNLVSNSVGKRDLFEDDYHPSAIFSDGTSTWYPGTIFSVSCELDIMYFPFDRQTCSVLIVAQEYAEEINFIPDPPVAMTGSYKENGEWELEGTEITTTILTFVGESFERLEVAITLRRRPAFFIVNVLVPMMFMSVLSSLVFVLPEDSGERASFSITVLLSLSVFLSIVSDQLPQNSDNFPIIINYLFSLLLLSGICVLVTVLQLRFAPKRDEKDKDSAETNSVNPYNHDTSQLLSKHFRSRSRSSASVHPAPVNNGGQGMSGKTALMPPDDIAETDVVKLQPNYPQNEAKDEDVCRTVCSYLIAYLKDLNVVLFVSFNVVWLIVTVYFLTQLIQD